MITTQYKDNLKENIPNYKNYEDRKYLQETIRILFSIIIKHTLFIILRSLSAATSNARLRAEGETGREGDEAELVNYKCLASVNGIGFKIIY
jgi:hypothetical protein